MNAVKHQTGESLSGFRPVVIGVAAMLVFCAAADAKPHAGTKQTAAVSAKKKTHHVTKTVAAPAPQHHATVQNAPPTPPSAPPPQLEPLDMSHAVPVNQAGALPNTKDRYNSFRAKFRRTNPPC